MSRVDPVRQAAVDVVRAVAERDAYANLVLPQQLRERKLTGRDAALATELTYGTCRAQGILDAYIRAAAGREVSTLDAPVAAALRVGVYQILKTRIDDHAAVDTTVEIVRATAGEGPVGFTNAVLRRIIREERAITAQILSEIGSDPVGHLAFEYYHPRWIAEVFRDALGGSLGALQAALAADDERPIVHLVARPGLITAAELAAISGGDEARYSPYGVYLPAGDPGQLEPVRDGLAAVQDEGSQLVARAVTVAPTVGPDTGRWLDLCAGPGGKAALLGAVAAIDGAQVDAVEPTPHRADLVRRAVADLPVTVHTVDGRDSGLSPGYDRVLVDAPCSGLGSLRRRPESRWRRGPDDIAALVTLQSELLAAAAALVRPGGVLAYVTCSPHPAETSGVVDAAVATLPLTALDARDYVPADNLGPGPYVQLWPHLHGTDAMFLALLRRTDA